jgi:hypothetical protein
MNVTRLKVDRTAAVRARRYRRNKRHGVTVLAAIVTVAALSLATVSGAFSVIGLTAIFSGATLPVVAMGAALELGKISAVAWLGRSYPVPRVIKCAIAALVVTLMAINAVGAFGFLSRAHIGITADLDTRGQVQGAAIADLDKRIAQVDAAVAEATRRGRTTAAMELVDRQSRYRAILQAERQREAAALAELQTEAATDDGPIRYIAELTGSRDETIMRFFILLVAVLLDPLAVLLLVAAVTSRGRA